MIRYGMMVIAILTNVVMVNAQEQKKDNSGFYAYLAGTYEMIGRYPDTSGTYSGTIVMNSLEDSVEITRTMGGETTTGIGKLVSIHEGRSLLSCKFPKAEPPVNVSYLIHNDGDNYAILTGWSRWPDSGNHGFGLEALFPQH